MHSLDFEEIVDRFYPMLYRFALSLARNEADACDLTQQTFSVWATKGHLLRDSSKAKSWLFTTLYREFISNRRREMRWPKEDISEVEHELPCAMPETVDCLESAQVMEALQSIDETFRVPLVAVLSPGTFLRGDRADSRNSHRHGDVAPVARKAKAAAGLSAPAGAGRNQDHPACPSQQGDPLHG